MTYFIHATKWKMLTISQGFSLKKVVKLHGLLKTIVYDRNDRFLSHFWRTIWTRLGTKLLFFITCHPQTVGETEVVNMFIFTLLKVILKGKNKSLDECLPYIEFVYNRVVHTFTNLSPFEVVYFTFRYTFFIT